LQINGLCKLYSLPHTIGMNKSRQTKLHVSEESNAYKVSVCKPDTWDYLGEEDGGCEDNLKKKTEYEGVYKIHLAVDRYQWLAFMYTVMNLWIS
jgi:hypothetical protein